MIVGLAVAAGATLAIPAATGWPLIPLAVLAGVGVGTVWTNTDMLVTKIAGDRGVRVGFIACGGAALAVRALLALRRPRIRPATPAAMQ